MRSNPAILYHAFPRWATASEPDESRQRICILEVILKHGLVITPEVVEWRSRRSDDPVYTVQKRACLSLFGRKNSPNMQGCSVPCTWV